MPDKLISVVVPSYNNGKYIGYSINSVLNQSYRNLELIIIDDNSIDETRQVLKKYEKDERIKTVLREHTGSIGKARNDAISISKGEYVAFLDSDDYWDLEKLHKQMYYADKYDIICTNAHSVNSENIIIKDKYLTKLSTSQEIKFADEIQENLIITSSVLLKKSIFNEKNKFPETKGFVAEDYYLWLKLMSKGINCYFVNENLVYYRMLKTKFNLDYNYSEIEFLMKSNEYRSEYLDKDYGIPIDTSIKKGVAKCFQIIGINFFKLNKKKDSLKYFLKHIKNLKYITSRDLSDSIKYIVKIILQIRSINN